MRGRANKYRAKAINTPDGRFHSQAEYARWCELKLLRDAGVISELKRQVVFPLTIMGRPILIRSERYKQGRACRFTADFMYVENNLPVVEDHKGFYTKEAKLRIAVAEAIYGFRVKITKAPSK